MTATDTLTIWLRDIERIVSSNEVQNSIFGSHFDLDAQAVFDWGSTLTAADIERMRETLVDRFGEPTTGEDGLREWGTPASIDTDEQVLVWWAVNEAGPWWVDQ